MPPLIPGGAAAVADLIFLYGIEAQFNEGELKIEHYIHRQHSVSVSALNDVMLMCGELES